MTTKSSSSNKKKPSPKNKNIWQKIVQFCKGDSQPKRGVAVLFLGGERDSFRLIAMVCLIACCMLVIVARAAYVQLITRDTYLEAGNRFLTTTRTQPVLRGVIKDRFGTPLAADAPLVTMAFSPYDYATKYYQIKKEQYNATSPITKQKKQEELDKMDLAVLAKVSGVSLEALQASVALKPNIDLNNKEAVNKALPMIKNKDGEPIPYRWFPLLRQVTPEQAKALEELKFVAVDKQVHQHRFYLQGEPVAQVLGYISDGKDGLKSRTGVERKYEKTLAGESGQILVLKNADNQAIKQLKQKKSITPSQDVTLTIDARLQYILYKELEQAGRTQEAMWVSGIITDIHTGDVLAMGSWPSFNNNDVSQIKGGNARNRAVMDIFEPGSVMKPLTAVAALESGKYNTNTWIDTSPGYIRVGNSRISDAANYKSLNLSGVISKSSNVGIVKIVLNLPQTAIFDVQKRFGFGQKTALDFPFEHTGHLNPPGDKDLTRRATMGYGYGQNVTLAQLVQAYGALGADGMLHPLRISTTDPKQAPIKVTEPKHARAVIEMMEKVTMQGGTGTAAAINGYRVAGKTGTSRRVNPQKKGEYLKGEYRNIFAGVAPASNPRFAVAILVEAPQKQKTAGQTAAPVFSRVMGETLRIYDVPFDKPLDVNQQQPKL